MGNTISKYDKFGVLKTQPWPDIKEGDRVGYIVRKLVRQPNGRKKPKSVQLIGYWKGDKVCFTDNEKTIVRTTRWLTNENVF